MADLDGCRRWSLFAVTGRRAAQRRPRLHIIVAGADYPFGMSGKRPVMRLVWSRDIPDRVAYEHVEFLPVPHYADHSQADFAEDVTYHDQIITTRREAADVADSHGWSLEKQGDAWGSLPD